MVQTTLITLIFFSDNDLGKFLSAKKPEKGQAWLDKCKTVLSKMLISKPDLLKANCKLPQNIVLEG